MSKNVLIVVAHPNPDSFNQKLSLLAKNVLEKKKYKVNVIDLYDVKFPQADSFDDFTHEFDRSKFNYKKEQEKASLSNTYHPDIAYSQKLITESNLLIFQFPLWWFSMPAILKNWIEKCFGFNFAYNGIKRRWFDRGPFKNKKVLLSITTSGPECLYTDTGINGNIQAVLWPITNGIFNFTGCSVLPPFISWGSDTVNRENKDSLEKKYGDYLNNIDEISSLKFRSLDQFDSDYRLKDKATAVYYYK